MRILLSLLFSTIILSISGQDRVKVSYKQTTEGYSVIVDNNEFCPVSIELNMTLKNMQSSNGNHKIFVIPPTVDAYEITKLSTLNPKKSSRFDINTIIALGDHIQEDYDRDFPYELPFVNDMSCRIMQGYNGSFSHKNQHALDFDIPEGGDVLAARDGVVVEVNDKNNKSCGSSSCNKFNNYVRIYHSDGTFAEYTHIKQRSAKVERGDKIKAGQKLAECGKVGWATGPHLHFEVYLLTMNSKKTVPTKFKISRDGSLAQLKEKESYRKVY